MSTQFCNNLFWFLVIGVSLSLLFLLVVKDTVLHSWLILHHYKVVRITWKLNKPFSCTHLIFLYAVSLLMPFLWLVWINKNVLDYYLVYWRTNVLVKKNTNHLYLKHYLRAKKKSIKMINDFEILGCRLYIYFLKTKI